MKKILIVVGAATGAVLVYTYTQNRQGGDPHEIGFWFSIFSFFFLIWIWKKLF